MKILPRILPAVCLLLAAGCSKSTSHTATTADGTKVTQSSKGSQVSMELTDKSGAKTSLNVNAKGMALPDDFAKDIPIHPKGVVQMVNQMGKDHTQVGVLVALPAAEVITYYETELKQQGWSFAPATKMGEGAMLTPRKDQRSISLMIAAQDPKTTFVQMMISTAAN